MARVWLAVGLALTGCLDFSQGRYWRCDSASDCAGGWYCAGDGFCRPPTDGRTSACGSDTQCAPGWRCNVMGVCQLAQAISLTSLTVQPPQKVSPQAGIVRVVASPPVVTSTAATSRLFVQTTDGARLSDLEVQVEDAREGIFSFKAVDLGPVTPPGRDDEVALTDQLVSSPPGRTQLCVHAPARQCGAGGGLLRSTVAQSNGNLVRALLVASGSTVERRPGGRWDLGANVVDLSGFSLGTSCDDALVAAVSFGPDKVGVLIADGGVPQLTLGGGERVGRLRPGTGDDRLARVLVEVLEPDGGSVIDLYAVPCSGQLQRVTRVDELCADGEVLTNFAYGSDSRIERLCGDGVSQFIEPEGLAVLSPFRVDTSSSSALVALSGAGAVRMGTSLLQSFRLVLDEPIERAFYFESTRIALTRGAMYGLSPGFGFGLMRLDSTSSRRFLGPVRGLPAHSVYSAGVILEDSEAVFVPRENDTVRFTAGTFGRSISGGSEVVAFFGDSVRTGRRADGFRGELISRDRPAPGFDITSAALRFEDGPLVASGYLVTNGRLFSFRVSSTLKVTSEALPLGAFEASIVRSVGDDFVAILDNGRVVALPTLAPLSPPLLDEGGLEAAEVWCGMPVVAATTLTGDVLTTGLATLRNGAWSFEETASPVASLHVVEPPTGPPELWLTTFDGEVTVLTTTDACEKGAP